ncbi:MAG: DinB family protein [Planctomycetota bacterium]
MSNIAAKQNRAATIIPRVEDSLRRLEAVARLDSKTLARSYAPGKWNGVELLAHLADADLMYYTRFLKVIAEEGASIVPFDQDRWAVELRIGQRPAAVSIAAIAAARKGFLHYLATMPPDVLERKTFHPERGTISALDLAELLATHALHHLEQLEAIRDGRGWTAKT